MSEPQTKMSSARERPDIRALTPRFNQPGGGIEPWLFAPASNIAEVSTTAHPGGPNRGTACSAGVSH